MKIGIGVSDRTVAKANRKHSEWRDCLRSASKKDWRDIQSLIGDLSDVGGTWEWTDRSTGHWSYNISSACEGCFEAITQITDEAAQRMDNRSEQKSTMNDYIQSRNSRQDDKESSDEMWDGINDALDRSQRQMDEMYRQRQQWNNNQIYISPGYN